MADAEHLQVRATLLRSAFQLDLSFQVAPGETLTIVGRSGAGKSTCLHAVAGLVRPSSAHVALGEELWCDTERNVDRPPHRRRVGFVHQDFALFPHLTVLENVLYGAHARRLASESAHSKAHDWMDRLGIAPFALRSVRELSGGERQRVALARALVSGAGVLLLDEPFGSLDASTRNTVRQQLGGFLRSVRLPTVLVTHDAIDALALGDRIAVLEDGRIVQIGPSAELLARPRSSFVAELFGLNFYRGALSSGAGLREVVTQSAVFHVLAAELSGSVLLSFPPSAVTLSLHRPQGSAQNAFQGVVSEIVPLPERTRVTLDCGFAIAADIAREAVTTLKLARGQVLWAAVKATAIHVDPQ
jgi:molybdate transport system ATP-binding protein